MNQSHPHQDPLDAFISQTSPKRRSRIAGHMDDIGRLRRAGYSFRQITLYLKELRGIVISQSALKEAILSAARMAHKRKEIQGQLAKASSVDQALEQLLAMPNSRPSITSLTDDSPADKRAEIERRLESSPKLVKKMPRKQYDIDSATKALGRKGD